jgi:type IV pilus assembly protein PilC
MPLYTYKVKTQKGELLEDLIQAPSVKDAASSLTSDGYKILTIKKVEQSIGGFMSGSISISEKANFCRFLATMLRAGLPLPEAIDIIREESKNRKLKKILMDVSFEVRKGKTISSVLSKYKKDFDPVFLTMVKAGEESGTMDKSFDYLSKQLIMTYELIQKVKGAMMYPIVILCAMVAMLVVMLVFVLPKLAQVFLDLNVPLPPTTKFVMGVGIFIGKYTTEVIIGVFALGILCFMLFTIQKTRDAIFDFFMKLPAIKGIVIQIDIARFSRTLSTLLTSGVPIMTCLEVCANILRQPALRKQAKLFGAGVAQGKQLSEMLMVGKQVFPPTVTQTIKAGEKSGSLEEVLEEMAEFYEREVDFNLKRVTSLIEPLLMLVIGIAVGAMVIIMITPIYSLVGGMGNFQ